MRPKVLLTILVLLCLALVLVWLTRPGPPVAPPSDSTPSVGNAAPTPAARDRPNAGAIGTRSEVNNGTPEAVSSTSAERSDGFQQWLQSAQPPIEFYGRVVDEREQPVQGAEVDFLWTHVHPEADFQTNTSSDARGSFSLSGVNGSALDVHVRKAGYYSLKSMDRNNFRYVRLPGEDPFHPARDKPVIFHLRKKGPGAALVTSQYGVSPELEVSVPRDGTRVCVDLLSRKADLGGPLEITQMKPQYLQAKNATTWSFQMAMRSGGFVEQNDEFPFYAPETGYQPVVAFQFTKGQTNWARALKRSYYITFGQPPRYGWLTVETAIGWGGARLQYAINPDGSRYLEPK